MTITDIKPAYISETKEFSDPYKKLGEQYVAYRPTYPQELFDIVKEVTSDTPQELCLDVGSGSGQATLQLASVFKKVIGVDPSPAQINNALKADNVEYLLSPAEDINYPSNSVDCITVSTAIHWFDIPKFFEESKRLLKQNGYLIFWCYSPGVHYNEEARKVHDDFLKNILKDYWSQNITYVDRHYMDIIPPFKSTTRKTIQYNKTLTIANIVNYCGTWSGYGKYLQSNPDYLPTLKQRFMDAYKTNDETFKVEIGFPIDFVYSKND